MTGTSLFEWDLQTDRDIIRGVTEQPLVVRVVTSVVPWEVRVFLLKVTRTDELTSNIALSPKTIFTLPSKPTLMSCVGDRPLSL